MRTLRLGLDLADLEWSPMLIQYFDPMVTCATGECSLVRRIKALSGVSVSFMPSVANMEMMPRLRLNVLPDERLDRRLGVDAAVAVEWRVAVGVVGGRVSDRARGPFNQRLDLGPLQLGLDR